MRRFTIRRILIGTVISILIVTAVIRLNAIFIWSLGGSEPQKSYTSPDGSYRVQFFTPTRLESLLHMSMMDPGFIELYNNRTGELIETGPVVDFYDGSNSQIIWLMAETGQIGVGMDTTFWHMPPLSPSGEKLPIKHELDPSFYHH